MFVAVIFYYFINKYIAASIKKAKEEQKKKELEFRVVKGEELVKGVKEMAG